MNQFFSFKRFSLLLAKHWTDNKKRYLLCTFAFIGLYITWFVFTMFVETTDTMNKELQSLTFLFSLFMVGTFYASQYFRDLGSAPKGINFLLVPASPFEKLLCAILFTAVFFFVTLVAAFYIADIVMIKIAGSISPGENRSLINIFTSGRIFFEEGTTINVLPVFFSMQAAFLLGAVWFKKYSFIKTIISGFIIFFGLFLLIFLCYDQLLPKGDYTSALLTAYRVHTEGKEDRLVQLPGWMGTFVYYTLLYAIAPFLWIVTYYRLKEKQV